MELIAFGVNHQTAPLAIREQVAFPAADLQPALRDLVGRQPVGEAAIISTCNRTEIYCAGEQSELEPTLGWLANSAGISADALRSPRRKLQREPK